jgi:hypothetical protein
MAAIVIRVLGNCLGGDQPRDLPRRPFFGKPLLGRSERPKIGLVWRTEEANLSRLDFAFALASRVALRATVPVKLWLEPYRGNTIKAIGPTAMTGTALSLSLDFIFRNRLTAMDTASNAIGNGSEIWVIAIRPRPLITR